MDQTAFDNALNEFERLPGCIDRLTADAFKSVLQSEAAHGAQKIVYVWRSERAFPRLKGESDIVYIGQTSTSLARRYAMQHKCISTKANAHKYGHIIQEFGPITISVCDFQRFGSSLLQAEGQLLWWYFRNHCEYPPLNYSKTKVRTDMVLMEEELS